MASADRLSVLADEIAKNVAEIQTALKGGGLPGLSFDLGAPPVQIPPPLNATSGRLLAAAEELQALVSGPLNHLMRLTGPQVNIYMSLHAITRYNVAKNLGKDETASYDTLAERCGIPASELKRFLRLAVVNHIFVEPKKDHIAHNALSILLVEFPLMDQWVAFVTEEMWKSGPFVLDAMAKWPGVEGEDPKHTGFAVANGVEETFFVELGKSKTRWQRFADAMTFIRNNPALDSRFLIAGLQECLKDKSYKGLMIDVGGSQGSILTAVLKEFPNATGIVQDLEGINSETKIDPEVKDRLSFMTHDFFDQQPVEADLYLLRSVFHDWSDTFARKILGALVPALKPGARLIVNEICVPEVDQVSFYDQQFFRGYDLAMKHNGNGRERNADEWGELFASVDSRFQITNIQAMPESLLAVIEVTWKG